MTSEKFEALKENIVSQLRAHLLPGLFYHSAEHTLDVLGAAERIGKDEKISDTDMLFLKTAALLHDSGYLFTAKNHEENSCRIARLVLPQHNYKESDINIICELIMATRVPHNPQNLLEEIICDADLDYLGREDFDEVSQNLFRELQMFAKVNDENQWNEMQVKFFEKHRYFTETSRILRTPVKEKHLENIRQLLPQIRR